MNDKSYEFYQKLARIINAGISRSIVLSGNIADLYWNGEDYTPLIPFLLRKTESDLIQIVYEVNTPIKLSAKDKAALLECWITWKTGMGSNDLVIKNLKADLQTKGPSQAESLKRQFDGYFDDAIGSMTAALQFLRQLCFASRACKRRMLIIIGGADMILPSGNGDLSALSDNQLRRISTVQDWFSDPAFVNGQDTVCLIAESRSQIHSKVSRMPQIVSVEAESPDLESRQHYVRFFTQNTEQKQYWSGSGDFGDVTAGLSLYALRQLLVGSIYTNQPLDNAAVTGKVEEYIKSQLGDDVVEFKKPSHTLDDIVGNSKLKVFLRTQVIPRVKAGGKKSLTGVAVSGPIGVGKSHIFEAVATELDSPVMALKNIRSQWFGGTDVIIERLYRVIQTMSRICIEIDEADTQFGGLGNDTHETERRLTGKIQQMMSDPELRGKVFWLLMTARIHRLSPDIRRSGRAGDLIIPVFDPKGQDRIDFIKWVIKDSVSDGDFDKTVDYLDKNLPTSTSAGDFEAMRKHLQCYARPKEEGGEVVKLIGDLIPADIAATREYQTLQALLNCTRKSLLPEDTIHMNGLEWTRDEWRRKIKELEKQGIQ